MRTSLESIPSHELLDRTLGLIRRGNSVEAELLAHLAEVDARRLYLEKACPSMFGFCVRILHFSEATAYKRIGAARAARRHPELLEAVRRGDLHVTAVSLLAPHLTGGNRSELIRAARHRTADEIRLLLAERSPKPSVPTSVLRVAETHTGIQVGSTSRQENGQSRAQNPAEAPTAAGANAGPFEPAPIDPKRRPRTEPLGGERFSVRFTVDAETHGRLQELRALMRHRVPDGDLAKIIARAVEMLHRHVRQQKFGECPNPRPAKAPTEHPSRSIPTAIRRDVTKRDGGRCAYVSATGRRCDARDFLEFHHENPWAHRRQHTVDGISLRCRAHNQHAACRDFGEDHMARFRRKGALPNETPHSAEPGTQLGISTGSRSSWAGMPGNGEGT